MLVRGKVGKGTCEELLAETKYLDLSGNFKGDRPSIPLKLTWPHHCLQNGRDGPQFCTLIVLVRKDTLQPIDRQVPIPATSLSSPPKV